MKDKILKLLTKSADYISGEELSAELNVTRAYIWKLINSLKNDGYNIEGVSNKGYKLIDSPSDLAPNLIDLKMKTKILGKNYNYYKDVSSTNDLCKEAARNGYPEGSLFVAEVQTAGRGRFSREWDSSKGGLWFSLLLRPKIEPLKASKLTIIAAAAINKALEEYQLDIGIKWPNDIYIKNKKISGILTEIKCDMDVIHYIVLGIGININNSFINSPLRDIATSLKDTLEKNIDRGEILTSILYHFEGLYKKYIENDDIDEVVEICRDKSILLHKECKLITINKTEKVIPIGINDDGFLIVRTEEGEEKVVFSGEISFSVNN